MTPENADLRASLMPLARSGAQADGAYYAMVVLSCVIATGGLITNSTAVIIGAMLIAPMMPPIMSVSLGILDAPVGIIPTAAFKIATGAGLAIALSAALAWLTIELPFDALKSIGTEIEVRSHPNPFDLGIALAGGVAAAYAMTRNDAITTLAGVAISTALMPPLCVVGIGLAVEEHYIWSGALLLFAANLVAIGAAATAVFLFRGCRPKFNLTNAAQLASIGCMVAILALLLFSVTFKSVEEVRHSNDVRKAVQDALKHSMPSATLTELKQSVDGGVLRLRLTVQATEPVNIESVEALQKEIATRLDRKTAVTMLAVPAIPLDTLNPPTKTPTATKTPSPTRTPTAIRTSTPARQTPQPTSSPPASARRAFSGGALLSKR